MVRSSLSGNNYEKVLVGMVGNKICGILSYEENQLPTQF